MRLIRNDAFWNDSLSDFDSVLERVFNDRSLLPSILSDGYRERSRRGFRVDSFVDDDGYRVVAELPGMPKEAIDIKLENAVLTIAGEHKSGEGDNARSWTFARSITVGDDVDADKVTAKFENGLLTVTLPKMEERKPRSITVA